MKLKKDNKDIYHYQSKLFNYSRDKVLNILVNLHEIMKKKGIISEINLEGEKNKEGTIMNFKITNPPKQIKIKINKFKVRESDIKWIICYQPLNASFSDSLMEWILLKLNDSQTLVTNTNKYIEQIAPEILQNLNYYIIKTFLNSFMLNII